MLIGVLEVDEERMVHSLEFQGVGLDRFTCAIDTACTKRKTLFLVLLTYSLEGSLHMSFDEPAVISFIPYSLPLGPLSDAGE
jgi:hypothetical protein